MATFTRTLSGIAVEHLFYRVDFMVYCEGNSLGNDSLTYDELFWTQIFNVLGFKVKCKSKGSKKDVEAIFKIVGSKFNVIFAVDRDYDDIFGSSMTGMLYTYGYNFESEVSSMFNFDDIIPLFINTSNRSKFKKLYEEFLQEVRQDFRRVAILDLAYFRGPVELYNRRKPLSVIVTSGTRPPRINKKMICENAILCKSAGKKDKVDLVKGINPYSLLCGKLVSRYIFTWMLYIAKKFGDGRNFSYESFMSVCINSINKKYAPKEIIDYYDFSIKSRVN